MKHFDASGLESALEKVARSLSEKFGITVVFQGDRCCTDGKTIYLPGLPDDLPKELRMVIRGWVDHESAHILFQSDMVLAERFQKAYGAAAFCVLNLLEDARIEAAATQRFPGSAFNLRMCYAEAARKAEKDAEQAPLSFLRQFIFAVHTCINDMPYLEFVGKEVREITDGLAPLLRQARACADTGEVEAIALKVWERIRAHVEADKTSSQAGGNDRGREQAAGGNPGAGTPTPTGAGAPGNATGGRKVDPSAGSRDAAIHQGIIGGMAADIAQSIGGYARANHSYRVWSTAYDRVAVARDRSNRSHGERMRDVMPLVSGVRQKLLQSLLAEPKARWLGDREQGAVDPRNLHRLALSDAARRDRIFRQRIRTKRLRTAVALLMDESNSMGGPKMRLAERTAMVFCEALARLDIPTCVIGFSTMKYTLELRAQRQTGMTVDELRSRFRLSPLNHTVYKRFDEPFAKISGRMEEMAPQSLTPLGESMLLAARQLAQRPEERKALFVMTDGKPIAGIVPESATFEHARRAIVRIEKAGIDVALVGIMEHGVTELHHRSVVVPSLDKLPRTVMNQLHAILTNRRSNNRNPKGTP